MERKKNHLYIFIPLVCAVSSGFYEWGSRYFLESSCVADEFEISQWALMGGAFYGVMGLWVGVIIDLLIWFIVFLNRKVKEL